MLNCVIDISHFNGEIDFSKVKSSGVEAVIIKATQGRSWIDPNFTKNMTKAIAAGLLVGAYHFGTDDDVQEQAKNFLNIAGAVPLKVLDFEGVSETSMSSTQANDFIQLMSSTKLPMIYADVNHIKQLQSFWILSYVCPLWIAQYKQQSEPEIPENTWKKWTMWQYTDSGIVDGIKGKVDRSYFNGELKDLQSLFS